MTTKYGNPVAICEKCGCENTIQYYYRSDVDVYEWIVCADCLLKELEKDAQVAMSSVTTE